MLGIRINWTDMDPDPAFQVNLDPDPGLWWPKTEQNYKYIFWSKIAIYLIVNTYPYASLKVHKNENFFGFDFEFCTISLLVMSKY